MADTRDACVGEEWQFAGRTSGSGDAASIGGTTSLGGLRRLESGFKNNKEFEDHWRDCSRRHARRGRMRL